MNDVINLNSIHIGEAFEDGSFSYVEGQNPSATIKYIINGTDDPYPAYAALINYLKANYLTPDGYIAYRGIPLDNIQLNRLACAFAFSATASFSVSDNQTSGPNQNKGTDPSSPIINEPDFEMPEIEPNDFQYSTVGGMAHITHGYASASYVAKKDASTYHDRTPIPCNGIGWNEGKFDGCDVAESIESFSISVSAPKSWITPEYRAFISSMANCVNLIPWFGYEPSCVLFKGMGANSVSLNYTSPNGESVQDWYWRLRFEFEARRAVEIPAPEVISNGTNVGKWKIDSIENDVILREQKDYLAYATNNTISGITASSDFAALYETLESYCASNHFKKTLTNSLTWCLTWIQTRYAAGDVCNSIYKPGFYHIWYKSNNGSSQNGTSLFPVVMQANLVQVYQAVDFNLLNLPDQSW